MYSKYSTVQYCTHSSLKQLAACFTEIPIGDKQDASLPLYKMNLEIAIIADDVDFDDDEYYSL